ncbi:histidine kinase N-terminal 7TM domain-containing diguanylate cyclase [Desulfocurvus sp. DL9XJH121]
MDVKLLFIALLTVSSVVTAFLSAYCGSRFKTPGAKAYALLMASITAYTLGYALELHSGTLEGIRTALRLEYLGIPFIPAFWMILAIRYAEPGMSIPRGLYAAILVIPVLTVVLHWTNARHHLFYASLAVNDSGPFPLADITRGVWYHVNLYYTNISVLVGNVIFLKMALQTVGPYRKQAGSLFAASLLPWVGNFIYQMGFTPYGMDIVPFALALSGTIMAWGLFRFRIFRFVPIARDTIFDLMRDPVIVLDDTNHIADFNPAAATVFPELDRTVFGEAAALVLAAYPDLLALVRQGRDGQGALHIQGPDEAQVFELSVIPIRTRTQRRVGRAMILHDITGRQQLLDLLSELANVDGLTGAYNHRHLMTLAREELTRAKRYQHPLTVVLADLDHFKKINDTHGHQAGDQVLKSVVQVCRNNLRSHDIFGRYGGEEFVMVLPETRPEDGKRIVERMRSELAARSIVLDEGEITVTASFGMSGYDCDAAQGEDTLHELLKQADQALYQAKRQGRNRIEIAPAAPPAQPEAPGLH